MVSLMGATENLGRTASESKKNRLLLLEKREKRCTFAAPFKNL